MLRNTERIVGHDDRPGESGEMDRPVHLRQRGPHRAIKPEVEPEEDDEQQYQNCHHYAKDEFAADGRAGAIVVATMEDTIVTKVRGGPEGV